MEKLRLEIEKRKSLLSNTEFCKWLATEESSKKFCFLPAQSFLVLGFRDILKFLRVKHPETSLEMQINKHCEEDSDHWKWYLDDLEYLGFRLDSWGPTVSDVFRRTWADENEIIRTIVYLSIYYIKKFNQPVCSLAVIEVLEAAFGAFIDNMTLQVRRAKLHTKLKYYGRTHIDKENTHSLPAWQKEQSIVIDDSLRNELTAMIEDIFNHFELMFADWYRNRESYHYYPTFPKKDRVTRRKTPEIVNARLPS